MYRGCLDVSGKESRGSPKVMRSFLGRVGGYGYECAFQKTDLALGAGVVKEPEAGASVHPHV